MTEILVQQIENGGKKGGSMLHRDITGILWIDLFMCASCGF